MFKPIGIVFGVIRNFMNNIEGEDVTADQAGKIDIRQNDSHYGRRWRQQTSVHRFWASHRYVICVVYGLPGFFVRLENGVSEPQLV